MNLKQKELYREKLKEFLLEESNKLCETMMNNYYIAFNGLGLKNWKIELMDFHAHKNYLA